MKASRRNAIYDFLSQPWSSSSPLHDGVAADLRTYNIEQRNARSDAGQNLTQSLLREAELAEVQLQHAKASQDYFLRSVASDVQKKMETDRWAFISEYVAEKEKQNKLRERLRRGGRDLSRGGVCTHAHARAPVLQGGRSHFAADALLPQPSVYSSFGNLTELESWTRPVSPDAEIRPKVKTSLKKSTSSDTYDRHEHRNRNNRRPRPARGNGGGNGGGERPPAIPKETQRQLLALIEARDVVVLEAASLIARGGATEALRRRVAAISAINGEIHEALDPSAGDSTRT